MYVIEGGVHDDLNQVLFSIFSAESLIASNTDELNGNTTAPKYADGDRDSFVALLFGRNIKDHILWLSHLIRAASYLEGGYLSLFFGPPAKAASVKALFEKARFDSSSQPVSLSGWQLKISYQDGSYTVHLKYVSLLIALFELLLESSFDSVQPILDKITTSKCTKSDIISFAKVLQTTLTDYLNQQLPTRQATRKLAAIVDYLENNADAALDSESVSDDHVLDFWKDALEKEILDFKTFNSVVEGFENLFAAASRGLSMKQAEQSFEFDARYGDRHSTGGRFADQHTLENYGAKSGEEMIRELNLAKQSGIRYFASQKQANALELLLTNRESIRYRPLTFLRYLVFGGHQAKITNRLRHADQHESVVSLISEGPELSYEALHEQFNDHVKALQQTAFATAHLLLASCSPYVLYLISGLFEDSRIEVPEELTGLSIQALLEANVDWGDIRSRSQEVFIEKVLEQLSDDYALGRSIRDKLQQAFYSINRNGFSEKVLTNNVLMELHKEAAPLLSELLRLIGLALSALLPPPKNSPSWKIAYEVDSEHFRDLFNNIYGVAT
jgi:hypothetical protein